MLEKLFSKRSEKYNPVHPRDPGLVSLFGGRDNTAAGKRITPDNATQINAVYSCVSILSEIIASLPLNTYERLQEGGKRIARTHLLFNKLHNQPNQWQTSFEWREMMVGHCALRGNAYSEIVPTGNNPVAELIPLHPDKVLPFRAPDGRIAYEYTPTEDKRRILLQNEVHHLRLRTKDGFIGVSPIDECRESLGLASAAEEFGSRFFSNGTVISGFLEHPGKMNPDVQQRLKKAWESRHAGAGNAHRVAVLEEGMTFKEIGIAPEQAQFLETRKFQIDEIARIFRIPPSMLAHNENTTLNNMEQFDISFVKYTLNPWLVRWEQAMFRDLLSDRSKRTYFIEFLVEGLLRGDTKTRAEYYKTMQGLGNMSFNEVREKENMNPIPGGDKHMVPMNMTTLERLGEEPTKEPANNDDEVSDDESGTTDV